MVSNSRRRWRPFGVALVLLCLCLASPCEAESAAVSAGAGAAVANPVPSRSADEMMSGNASRIIDAAGALTDALKPILAAAPRLPAEFGALSRRIADSAGGSLSIFLVKLATAFAAALGMLRLTHRALTRFRSRHLARGGAAVGLSALTALLAADVLAVLAMLLVTYAAHALWFADGGVASEMAMSLIGALVYWRLMLLPVDLVLRHREAGARLVNLGERTARHLRQGASALVAFQVFSTALLRGMYHAGIDVPALRLIALCLGVLNAAVALYFIRRVRRATAAASAEGAPESDAASASSGLFLRLWHPLALGFVALALAAWILGVTLRDLKPFWALIDTAGVLIAVWVLDVIAGAALARLAGRMGEGETAELRRRRQRVLRHCFDVALWLGAAAILIELWMTRLSGLLPSEGWARMRGSVGSAIATIYVAYVLWQIIFMHTERHIRAPIQANAGGGDAPPAATRLQTVLPILRIFMLVTIAVLAALIALSYLGVNTTSLIAGASIFGLAISFGSQSLVRDIVSGIFFMADDAFRIGEYIDTGRLKGTVEGMSIRSLRLRHQNGQIHVIPFGMIQHVTNFSRDWTTVKFNLQLAHESDIELVRKTVKQIGVEMLSDPELAPELIAPLKMQGVTEIGPNAVVVRFKFTARPVQPTFVYRAALKRIYTAFREKGIEFANPTVYVQSRSGPAGTGEEAARLEAMGAAARSLPPAAN